MSKEWTDPLGPFNSLKCIAWREQLEQMAKGGCPAPITVTIDPTNVCNLSCEFCIMSKVREEQETIPDDVLLKIPEFLGSWNGVKSVCVGGGGEPFCHPKVAPLLNELVNEGLAVGTITNGVHMTPEARRAVVDTCRWIGFSVDAGIEETWKKLKRPLGEGKFKHVLDNIEWIAQHRRATQRPSIGFKYLFHPDNYTEVYKAVKLAKELGCDEFHGRPVVLEEGGFSDYMIESINRQLDLARGDFEDYDFKVYGIVHKFSEKWNRKIKFDKCRALCINAYFLADQTLALCCDRRGDRELNLGPYYPFDNVLKMWGSGEHKRMIDSVNLGECPRCTQGATNEIIQRVIMDDSMCMEFV